MSPKDQFYRNQALTVIGALKKRQIAGHYCSSRDEVLELLQTLVKEGSTISWGGSMTVEELGIIDSLSGKNLRLIDRMQGENAEERTALALEAMGADYYFMSSNAITLDGKLVNIDGAGNRIAALIYGPREVIIVAGMNKVEINEEAAVKRVQNTASPANTVRLKKNTPCAKNGVCSDCLSDDCICSHILITRRSIIPERIRVILVGEELGY